jgi:carbon-monoxide dehydrogenase medium subunit
MTVFYRRLPRVRYVSPRDREELFALLFQHKGKTRVLAGGTDLIPALKRREVEKPEYIVDLKGLDGLDSLAFDGEKGLVIGALATIDRISRSPFLLKHYPSLVQAASGMASPQVRNRGTFAGNLCSAVPSADSAPPLLALDTRIRLEGPKGERTLPLDRFLRAPRETALEADEIVTALSLPLPPRRNVYLKLSPRHSMDLAVVGVAAAASIQDGRCSDIRIALGAVAAVPFRAGPAENILRDKAISPTLIEEAARAAMQQSRPIDDHRASAGYRREMVGVLTRRALQEVLSP